MKLYIDTSDREKIVVGLGEKKYEEIAHDGTSQKLLPLISEGLKKQKIDFKDITQIEVETGPGSFTGLRIGVSVANALGWALGVKVNGKNINKGEVVDIKYK